MNPRDPSTELRALHALIKHIRNSVQPPPAAALDRGLKRLMARATSRKVWRARILRYSPLVVVLAAVCVWVGTKGISLLRRPAHELPALLYRIEGGSVLSGGYLRELGEGGIRLFFNDGTKVALIPGARGHLQAPEAEGTRIVIDQGTASFDVARTKDRRWFVEAGPFSVAVKGTFFSVSWEPASERFELRLQHGSVVVSGPIAGGDIELRAGQRLLVNLSKEETVISETPEPATSSTPSLPSATPPASSSVSSTDTSVKGSSSAAVLAGGAGKVERKPSWPEYLVHGQWDRILAEAEARGIETTLASASSDELFALADAARYRRRNDLARSALLAQRRRFASSARSVDVAFLLGRVEETRDRARALSWYDEYLERAAGGAYAAEAWGRKMVLTNELKGRAVARPIAEEYLRRFPKGGYAEAARALCAE